jgi:hypothetical protein
MSKKQQEDMARFLSYNKERKAEKKGKGGK